MTEEPRHATRRTVLKIGAGAAFASGIGGFLLGAESAEATASVQGLSASDVSVSSGDGEVGTLTLDPALTIEWSDFSDPVHTIDLNIYAETPDTTFPASYNQVLDGFTASANGSASPDIATINLLAKNRDAGGLVASNFADSTEGDGPEETQVTVRFDVSFLDAEDEALHVDGEPSLVKEATYTVSVTNEAATATISGSLNTAGS